VPGQYGQPAPPRDEIEEFEDLQSCGTTEACWRLYGFETSMLYPPVQRLDVHVYNQIRVVLQQGNHKRVMNEENLRKTTLTALFDFNPLNAEFFTPYRLFSENCTWIETYKMCKLRQARFTTIDRVHIIQPVKQELYFLRTLMSSNHSAGKKSFEDVRTVLDVLYHTYMKTCVALGFLDDDNEWDMGMT
jgi:hypothetical protein